MGISQVYRIETERLVIRCYQPTDAKMLHDAITGSLDHLRPWLPWAKGEPTEERTKVDLLRKFRGQFDLGIDYCYGIFDRSEKVLIGSTGLHPRLGSITAREIGYWVNVKFLNRGYASEAVRALTKTGFELDKLERIEIHCDARNTRSRNIPEKLGYRLANTIKIKTIEGKDETGETMIWSMRKDAYLNSPLTRTALKVFDTAYRPIGI